MKPELKEDTINKSLLLNWLSSSDEEVSILQLGQWVTARTNGRYSIVKNDKEASILPAIEI